MNIQHIKPFTVTGIKTRTNNKNEISGSQAKIGELWQQFYEKIADKLTEKSSVYGVYSGYESDHKGDFDVIVAANELSVEQPELHQIEVQEGDYLVFSANGKMPEVVIELWNNIWQYFESENCQHVRAFTTDFEFYKSPAEIEIYIAIR